MNLPITLFILIAGFLCLPNNRNDNVKKIDIGGILILTVMILALMYGLKNIDFFDLKSTLISTSVYPFLTLFGILIPFFILAEKKAEDPVMNLSYFTNSRVMITFIIAFITGIVLMGMIFVPQFAENSLKIASGSGGYFVIILGLFAGVGAPLSGKLIDKYGPKMILGLGFLISLLGSLFLIFVAADQPSMLTVNISLVLMGLGMGFTMGTPLNYMMLENTKDEESNSALAALSLVRSIGTAIAPAVMVGFLAHAGVAVQNNVMNLLPKEVSIPKLPYAQELTTEINEMKSNPMMKNVLATVDMPNFSYLEKIEINMNGSSDYQIPDELMDKIKSSDVTTITENSKLITGSFFAGMAPDMISNIQTGIQNGIDELTVVESMPQSSVSFRDTIEKMTVLKDAVPGAFDTAKQNYLAEIDQRSTVIESEFQKP